MTSTSTKKTTITMNLRATTTDENDTRIETRMEVQVTGVRVASGAIAGLSLYVAG